MKQPPLGNLHCAVQTIQTSLSFAFLTFLAFPCTISDNMISSKFHQSLWLGLLFASAAQSLSLDSFGGQAERKLLMENVVGESEAQQRTVLIQASNDEEKDYTCTKTKLCKLGCCGPL